MLAMVPVVLLLNGFTKGDWLSASLFAVSVAVGLTPEMLPMIVTACLAKGAVSLSRRKVIVKNLNSIQNLGAMDVLCTDKTGTLTLDKVVLEMHLNAEGREDASVLFRACLNSRFQTGLKNLMDVAVIERAQELGERGELSLSALENFRKADELPFDFSAPPHERGCRQRGEMPARHQGRRRGDAFRLRLCRVAGRRRAAHACTAGGDPRAHRRPQPSGAARAGRRTEEHRTRSYAQRGG